MGARFWGYRKGRDGQPKEFVFLANWRGSASCRIFDAANGRMTSENTARNSIFESVYSSIYQECTGLPAPPGARAEDMSPCLPGSVLASLQAAAGINITAAATSNSPGESRGMLAGVDQLVNRALRLDGQNYASRTASILLSRCPSPFDPLSFVANQYDRIEMNWDRSTCRSKALWRWEAQTVIAGHNHSPEKTLEKAIVSCSGAWVNQIPAASGLLRGLEERHRNVDLGRRLSHGHYELIELKAGENADTPLRAAIEILHYGLLYCFARLHERELELPLRSELMLAHAIELKVLAPLSAYNAFNLAWFGELLNTGVSQFARQRFGGGLALWFAFEAFPEDFVWPGASCADVLSALERRRPIWRETA